MKKVGIVFFAVALLIGLVVSNFFSFGRIGDFVKFSMNFGGVHGSGNIQNEMRNVSGFTAVDVGGGFQIEIVAGKDFSVEIEADDNLLPLITTEVNGSTLRIDTEKRVSTHSPLRVRISAPDIDHLEVSGGVNLSLTGIKNSNLSIDSSGGSKVTLSGETAMLDVNTSGGAKILALDLASVDANIDGSGGSYVEVNVSGELHSDISGGSRVVYSGTPSNIFTNKSGAARVSQK